MCDRCDKELEEIIKAIAIDVEVIHKVDQWKATVNEIVNVGLQQINAELDKGVSPETLLVTRVAFMTPQVAVARSIDPQSTTKLVNYLMIRLAQAEKKLKEKEKI